MRKFLTCFFTALLAAAAFAQTPDEIVARMDRETERFDQEGCSLIMDVKIPILGTFSTKMYVLGEKTKGIVSVKGVQIINWSDHATDWTYDSSKNEVTIKNAKPSGTPDAENLNMLDGVTDGYDVKLKKEDDQAWYFRCTRMKSNPNKDDPKAIDLVVSKSTYLPVSVKASEKGVTIVMRDFAVGVTEKDVTFDAADFPDAKIMDQR